MNREPKPLRQIDDSIPAVLEDICTKALAKQVRERYATAKDFANDLQRLINQLGDVNALDLNEQVHVTAAAEELIDTTIPLQSDAATEAADWRKRLAVPSFSRNWKTWLVLASTAIGVILISVLTFMVAMSDRTVRQGVTGAAKDLVKEIQSANGMLASDLAFWQTMPLEHAVPVVESLRREGYRLLRFRPYGADNRVLVAAVCVRDGAEWDFLFNASAQEIRAKDRQLRKNGLWPIDVAATGASAQRFYAVWAAVDDLDSAEINLKQNEHVAGETFQRLTSQGFALEVIPLAPTGDGAVHSNNIYIKKKDFRPWCAWTSDRGSYENKLHEFSSLVQTDISLLAIRLKVRRKSI